MSTMLLTVFDKDAEKAGPIFTAANVNVAKRLIFSQYKDMPKYIAERMDVRHVGNFDMIECSISIGELYMSIGTISDIQDIFKEPVSNDS